jgi:aryl-alcohol dehydrogenase-like predicted oxidoreductase
MSVETSDTLRYTKIPLNNGSGAMPAVGFGTLIPDPVATKQATKTALEVGFRNFDCAERYRNEEAVGEAMQEVFKAGAIRREGVFVTTKLWNTNHRPERSSPPLTPAAGGCKSTPSIAISSTPPLPFGPATSRTRGTSAIRSSMIPE